MDENHNDEDVEELKKTMLRLLVMCDKQSHLIRILTPAYDALMSAYGSLSSNITAETKILADVMEALADHLKSNNLESCDPQFVRNQMVKIAQSVRVSADGLAEVVDATNPVLKNAEQNWEWTPSSAISNIEGINDV